MSLRIFALSDTHGLLDFKLPKADLILHAGDICPDFAPRNLLGSWRQQDWLNGAWARWVNGSTLKATLGNHDFVVKSECPKQIKVDELIDFQGLKIWFSPWSPEFCGWAWMWPDADLKRYYDRIPAGVDIIVSHSPPKGYGDWLPDPYTGVVEHLGSQELLLAINRVKPKVVVCGHIHGAHGHYRHQDTDIYNVSLLNEAYERVNEPTEITL